VQNVALEAVAAALASSTAFCFAATFASAACTGVSPPVLQPTIRHSAAAKVTPSERVPPWGDRKDLCRDRPADMSALLLHGARAERAGLPWFAT
jgi:hypothetical protein